MNNAVFGKTIENVRKHRDIEFVTAKRRTKYSVSEPNYHTIKLFTENLLATEVRKTQILMKKAAYLGFWILDLYKTVTYDFWYDYIKLKYGENAKLCDIDTKSFIFHKKQIIFTKTMQKMLKQGWILQILN